MCLVSSDDDLTLVPALVRAGVDAFQVRDKTLTTRQLVALTQWVQSVSGTTVIVNDRLDVALAVGADGVHLGADDLSVAQARRLAPGLLIGATCRDRHDLAQATAEGADYAGVGPVFATTSKDGLPEPLGVGGLAGLTGLPVLAIGGITAERAPGVAATGVYGLAVIGGIWSAPDPVAAAAALAEAVAR
jgi:thiamine-phosphate pyrophosphorylase